MVVRLLPLLVFQRIYCLLFNVLFYPVLERNVLYYTTSLFSCQHFFRIFLKYFLLNIFFLLFRTFPYFFFIFLQAFGRNKKLVIVAFFSFGYLFTNSLLKYVFCFRDFVLSILPFLFLPVNTFFLEIFTFFISFPF